MTAKIGGDLKFHVDSLARKRVEALVGFARFGAYHLSVIGPSLDPCCIFVVGDLDSAVALSSC